MKHLTRTALVDLVERLDAEKSVPHLASCARCRRHLHELRDVVNRVADVHVPEPSPLFWDHLSARIGEAVAVEQPGNARPVRDTQTWWRHGWPIAAAVALLIVAASSVVSRRATFPVPANGRDAAIAVDSSDPLAIGGDETTLAVVADLGRDLDWDDLHDGGIVVHSGLVDRAVNGLSEGERAELGRLLKQELSGGGD